MNRELTVKNDVFHNDRFAVAYLTHEAPYVPFLVHGLDCLIGDGVGTAGTFGTLDLYVALTAVRVASFFVETLALAKLDVTSSAGKMVWMPRLVQGFYAVLR